MLCDIIISFGENDMAIVYFLGFCLLVGFAKLIHTVKREQEETMRYVAEHFELAERISNAEFQTSVRNSINLMKQK